MQRLSSNQRVESGLIVGDDMAEQAISLAGRARSHLICPPPAYGDRIACGGLQGTCKSLLVRNHYSNLCQL